MLRSTRIRSRACHGRRFQLWRQRVQQQPGQSPAGVGLQTICLRRRPRQRFHARQSVLDAPFVMEQGNDKVVEAGKLRTQVLWPVDLAAGHGKKPNLMTVRMAQEIGMNKISPMRGASTSPEYAACACHGAGGWRDDTDASDIGLCDAGQWRNKIEPVSLTVFRPLWHHALRQDTRPCIGCNAEVWADKSLPICRIRAKKCCRRKPPIRLFPCSKGRQARYGPAIHTLGKPLAGKTGTTNDNRDAGLLAFRPIWLSGYMSAMTNRSLGTNETGGRVAAPIFRAL